MKISIKYVVMILLGLFVLLFFFERGCRVSTKRYDELKGQLQSSTKKVEEKEKEVQAAKLVTEEEIEKNLEETTELKTKIQKVDDRRKPLLKKEREYDQVTYDLAEERKALTNKDLIISNQDKQIETWKERFWNERADKNIVIKQRNWWAAIAFKNYENFFKERGLRISFEKQSLAKDRLLEISGQINKEGEKILRKFQLKLNLETVIWTGLGFFAGVAVGG